MDEERTEFEGQYKISIELGQTAKRDNYIKSVKVRGNTPQETAVLLDAAIEQANFRVRSLSSGEVRQHAND